MKAFRSYFAAVIALSLTTAAASAQYYYPAQTSYPGCSPTWYGPNMSSYMPPQPYSGIAPFALPVQQCPQQQYGQQCPQPQYSFQCPAYPAWNRSPRDFFMWTEAQKERLTRETRPPFVP